MGFVVLIIGNSKSNHLGAQGIFKGALWFKGALQLGLTLSLVVSIPRCLQLLLERSFPFPCRTKRAGVFLGLDEKGSGLTLTGLMKG